MQTKVRGEIEQCLSLSPSSEKIDITRFLDHQRTCSTGVSDGHTPTDLDSPSMDDEEPMSVDSPSPSGVPFGVRFRSPSDTDSQSSMTKEVSDAVFEQQKDESVWFCNNEFCQLLVFRCFKLVQETNFNVFDVLAFRRIRLDETN